MKKLLNTFAALGAALSLMVGCVTIKNLTPEQIARVGVVITQTADVGAVYAIQQDARNATYFKLANPILENFANGTDLSPAALQTALAPVTGTNVWVGLAISGAVVIYDVTYSQYISGQLETNAPAAKAWILAIETGFQQALAQTGNATALRASRPVVPYFVKDGKVDRDAIKAKVKAATKK
jgi:hypothetical protein